MKTPEETLAAFIDQSIDTWLPQPISESQRACFRVGFLRGVNYQLSKQCIEALEKIHQKEIT